jgi:PAS domain S-box-containing protein
LLAPLGIAAGIPYVAPVLLAMWFENRRLILTVAATCTALTVLGFLLSLPGASLWAVVPNRLLTIGAMWSVAFLALARRSMEETLRQNEERMRAILATTADGLLTLDPDLHFLSINNRGEQILDTHQRALVDRTLYEFLAPSDRVRLARRLAQKSSSADLPSLLSVEVEMIRPSGEQLAAELVLIPIMTRGGLLQFTATLRDVTARRRVEQQLFRKAEEERRAFARELHEELGQTLTGLNLIGRQLARRLDAGNSAEAADARDLALLISEADALALQLYQTLAPASVNSDLNETIAQSVEAIAKEKGLRLTVTSHRPLYTSDDSSTIQIYRIVRDLVQTAVAIGRVTDIDLRFGEPWEEDIQVGLRGVRTDTAEWTTLMEHLSHRARLTGLRIDQLIAGGDESPTVSIMLPEQAIRQSEAEAA